MGDDAVGGGELPTPAAVAYGDPRQGTSPDLIRCLACGADLPLDEGICPGCGELYCPGCGQPLDEEEGDECPACGLALTFACPGCGFPVTVGARLCPECNILFIRRCPGCGARILKAPATCPECGQILELERRPSATIFAAQPPIVLLRCPTCACKFGSELGACPKCGQRVCPACFLLLYGEEVVCPNCGLHAARPCPSCGVEAGLGLG